MTYFLGMSRWERSVPSLANLIAFEAAHRHANFTRAAEELHYSQATVSRRIGALEADLGAVLFERGRHDVTPTIEADALADTVRAVLGDLAATADGIRRRSAERTRLTIRSDVSLTAAVVNPILVELLRRHPQLDIRVETSFEPIETDEEPFDIGIQYGRNRRSTLIEQVVADDEVFPVCAPAVADSLPPEPTVRDLVGLRLLHVDYGEPAWTDWEQFLGHLGAEEMGQLRGLTLSTYVVCLDLAERGQGVALGWGRTAQPRIDSGALVRIPGFTQTIPDAIRAYRPPAAEPWAPIDDLLSMLRDRLR
ncbi:MAG: LysR substrate-binding domain-containing protein [Actinomycetota bacterium]